MEDILVSAFEKILNMSITGGYIILAVLLARLILRSAPKKYSYALWAVALFRLICPVSFKSVISVFALKPFDIKLKDTALSSQTAEIVHIPENIGLMAQPEIQTGISAVDAAVNESLPVATPMYSANPMQIWEFFGMLLWIVGIAAMLAISFIGLWQLCRRLRTATLLESNVWQSENVQSPFIIGFFKPKIYIPYGLEGAALGYVLAHERAHIKRGDHVIRTLAYLVLCLHWFNPLVWLAFWLAGRDMELSCDEKVLGRMGGRAEYSETLLSFASPRRFPAPTPLAFGESGVARRIKNALKWKRPRLWISVVALVLCAVVIAACAANPKVEDDGWELGGRWTAVECVYQNPTHASSHFAGDAGCIYDFHGEGDGLAILDSVTGEWRGGYSSFAGWKWQEFPYSDEQWENLFVLPESALSQGISGQYDEILYMPLIGNDTGEPIDISEAQVDCFLMGVDGELWFVKMEAEANEQPLISSIFALVPAEDGAESASAAANSLWKLLTELDENNVSSFGITAPVVDADISISGIRDSFIDALKNIRPEEIKVGRGIPWKYSIDIGYGPSDNITLGYGGRDFVELQLSEDLKEMYPAERGVWEIHNDALTELMAALEAKPFAEFELTAAEEVKILFDIPGADLVDYSRQTEAYPVGNSIYSSSYSGKLFGERETLLWAPYVERGGNTYPAEQGEISVNIWRDNDFIQGWLNFRCSQDGDTTYCKAYASGAVSARLDEASGQIIVTPEGEFRHGMYEYISGLEAKDVEVVGINPTKLNGVLPDDLNEAVAEAFGKVRASELSIGYGVIFEAELALKTPEGTLCLLYDGDKVMLDFDGELEKKYSGIVGRWMIDSPAIRSLFDSILSGTESSWDTAGVDIFGESTVFSYTDMKAAIDRVLTHMSFNPPSADVKLLSLGYDEELSLRKAPNFAKQYGADEAIVLVSDFEVGKSWGAFNPNSTYRGYEWVLVRDIGGDWVLKTWGYG
ncbi:MAG: hypothetical protein E7420_00335 [Ruminococcaceae bacterium]|nr:hypothetical protein [Oscillospiraceae bacterium]